MFGAIGNFLGNVGRGVENFVHPQAQPKYDLGSFLQNTLGKAGNVAQAVVNPGTAVARVAPQVLQTRIPGLGVSPAQIGAQLPGAALRAPITVAQGANNLVIRPIAQNVGNVGTDLNQAQHEVGWNQSAANQQLAQLDQIDATNQAAYKAGKISLPRLNALNQDTINSRNQVTRALNKEVSQYRTPGQAIGDLGQLGANILSSAAGGGGMESKTLGQAALQGALPNAGWGVAQGAANAMSNKGSATDIAKQALLGGAQGAVMGAALGSLGYGASKLGKAVKDNPQMLLDEKGSAQIDPTANPDKPRGFGTTLQESPNTSQPVKQGIDTLDTTKQALTGESPSTYTPITNADTLAKAQKAVSSDFAKSYQDVLDPTAKFKTALDSTKAQVVLQQLQQQGRIDEASQAAFAIMNKATNAGQAVQALSIWDKMSPETILATGSKAAGRQLTPEETQHLLDLSSQLAQLPEGRAKQIAGATLARDVSNLSPNNATAGTKAAASLRLAQLLNAKTMVRKTVSETGLNVGQDASHGIGSLYDRALNAVGLGQSDGLRTVAAPQLGTQLQGMKTGASQAIEDAKLGIDTNPSVSSAYGTAPRHAFTNPVLKGLETAQSVGFNVPTRAMWQGKYDEALQGLMKANGVTEPTSQMSDLATNMANSATLQNNSKPAQVFSGIKTALNAGKSFGLGNVVDNYPKIPGNLMDKAYDYSPLGLGQSLVEPLIRKATQGGMTPEQQNEVAMQFGRGVLGTTGLAGAYQLAKQGLLTGKNNDTKKIAGVDRNAGDNQYELNLSGLGRLAGGNNPALQQGDNLVNFDWAEPFSPTLAGAANAVNNQTAKQKAIGAADTAGKQLMAGIDTVGNQPVLQGLQKAFGGPPGSMISNFLTGTLTNTPAAFVPSVVNQVRQYTDNTARDTTNPGLVQQTINQVKNKIPGASQTLQPLVDNFGNPVPELPGGSTNSFTKALNVFFNPAKPTTYNPTDNQKIVTDLYHELGDSSILPTVEQNSVKINGQALQLSDQQQHDYSQWVGDKYNNYLNQVKTDPNFQNASPKDKAAALSAISTSISDAAKIQMFGDQPKTINKMTQGVLGDSGLSTASSPVVDQAKLSLAKSAFASSDKNYQLVGDNVLRKDSSGNVTVTPKLKFDYQLGQATLTSQKSSGNIRGYLQTAQSQLQNIATQLQDPSVDPLDAVTLQNEAATLQSNIAKYSSYGGFTKPKAPKAPRAIAATGIKGLTTGKLPTLRVAKARTYRAPRVRAIASNKKVKMIA